MGSIPPNLPPPSPSPLHGGNNKTDALALASKIKEALNQLSEDLHNNAPHDKLQKDFHTLEGLVNELKKFHFSGNTYMILAKANQQNLEGATHFMKTDVNEDNRKHLSELVGSAKDFLSCMVDSLKYA